MSLPVILTAEAEAELDEAAQWYEQRSAGLGVDLVARVRDTLSQIGDTPELYPEVHNDIRRAAVRRFPYGVFYRRTTDRVEVIAVFHDRRDPSIWQSRA
jgi:plasmid stabilization system protein ParE